MQVEGRFWDVERVWVGLVVTRSMRCGADGVLCFREGDTCLTEGLLYELLLQPYMGRYWLEHICICNNTSMSCKQFDYTTVQVCLACTA
jgi:hypothetical protein